MKSYVMGIDLGTSGVKIILVDREGKTVASATESYPLLTPKPGWTEQNPEDWWEASCRAIAAVLKSSAINPSAIDGIGFSGQMHGSVFLDKQNKVVRPCLLWNDGRTAEVCQEITRLVGRKKIHRHVANPVLTGFTLPKVVWLMKHEPAKAKRVKQVLLPKDYLRYRLTGILATEVSDAAGTVMYDVRKNQWSLPILKALEIPAEWLPTVKQSSEVCGTITESAAEATGLAVGTPVVGGAADQPAGAIGTGVVQQGQVMCSIGTSGTVFAVTAQPEVDPDERLHTFNHAVQQTWYLMGCMLSAGGSLAWYRDHFASTQRQQASKAGVDVYEILMEQAAAIPIGSEGLFFQPYLTGERSPHKTPHARGSWIGLSLRTTPAHMIRSIIEGVTFGLRDSLEVVRHQGVKINQVRVTGGGARSPLWRQILADTFNTEIVTVSSQEGPALGAAILAAVGGGWHSSVPEACQAMIQPADKTRPVKKNVSRYEQYYQKYATLYPRLKDIYEECVQLGA